MDPGLSTPGIISSTKAPEASASIDKPKDSLQVLPPRLKERGAPAGLQVHPRAISLFIPGMCPGTESCSHSLQRFFTTAKL